jgi:hypothetical protein
VRAALPADAAVFSDMTQIAYLGNYARHRAAGAVVSPQRLRHARLCVARGDRGDRQPRRAVILSLDFWRAPRCKARVRWSRPGPRSSRNTRRWVGDLLAVRALPIGGPAAARTSRAAAACRAPPASACAALRAHRSSGGPHALRPTLVEAVAADFIPREPRDTARAGSILLTRTRQKTAAFMLSPAGRCRATP